MGRFHSEGQPLVTNKFVPFFQSTVVAFFVFFSFASENKLKRTEKLLVHTHITILLLFLLLHSFCLLLLLFLYNVTFLVYIW
jgi:hypothetical protein